MLLNYHRLHCIKGDFTLSELSTGWLASGWTLWFDCSWVVFLVILLLEYFSDCTIRMTVLLEYLDHAFLYVVAICFITHWYFFGRGSFLCLVHLHRTSFLFVVCVMLVETLDFLITQNWSSKLPKLGLTSYLCCLLLNQFLTTKRHSSDV